MIRTTSQRMAVVLGAVALSALSLTGCAPSEPAVVVPTVKDAWIKAAPDVKEMNMTGMFGVFSNSSDEVIYILGGEASDASLTDTKLDAHEVVKDESGKMVMQEVKTGIPIPAHGSVTVKPGGFHIMFWNLKKPIVAGDTVDVTVKFSNGTSLEVTADARDIANYAG